MDPNDLAVRAFQLANEMQSQNVVHLCVSNEAAAKKRAMAEQLTSLGYDLPWCIKALEQSRRSALSQSTGDASSSDDDDNEDESDSQQFQQRWITNATDWLLTNAPNSQFAST